MTTAKATVRYSAIEGARPVTSAPASYTTSRDTTPGWLAPSPANLFSRLFVDLVTPFGPGGIDGNAFGDHCSKVLKSGAGGVVVCGASGEGSTLLEDEPEQLTDVAVAVAAGQAPVIAAIECNNTACMVRRAITAERRGAVGLLCVVPFYNKPGETGLEAHFRAIARAVSLPILVLDWPARTGISISTVILERLWSGDVVDGLADASASVSRASPSSSGHRRHWIHVCANDFLASPYLAMGSDGWLSASANLLTPICRNLLSAWRRESRETALVFQALLSPIHDALDLEPGPAALKYALALHGQMSSQVRLPLVTPSTAARHALEGALDRMGAAPVP